MKLKRFLVVFLSAILIQISVGPAIASEAYSTIHGSISTINGNFDIDNVNVKIYKLEPKQKDEYGTKYSHIYQYSVKPDDNGKISFSRPSAYCYVSIDMNSVPANYGVLYSGFLIKPNKNEFSFSISKIADFDAALNSDDVTFYDKEHNKLETNSKYKINFCDTKNILQKNNIKAECKIGDVTLDKYISVKNLSTVEKIDYLCDNKLINEKETIEFLVDSINNNKIESECDFQSSISKISEFTSKNKVDSSLKEKLDILYDTDIPSYNNEVVYTSGSFSIHYESGSVSSDKISSMATYFNMAKTFLCFYYGYETPNYKTGESTYQVYINLDCQFSGRTFPKNNPDGTVYSYFVMNVYNDNFNYTLGSVTHEFMHAIQFKYSAYTVNTHYSEMSSFNEAVCNTMKLYLVSNPGISYYVNMFLNSPNISLFTNPQSGPYKGRCYGAVLFPLYIEQEYNSFFTIKNIYEENRNVHDVYDAIDNVLSGNLYNSSFVEAYLGCMLYNYDVAANYDRAESDWQNCASLTNASPTPTSYTLPNLSSRYFELSDSTYNTFTFQLSSSSYLNDACLQRVITTSSGVYINKFNFASLGHSFTYILNSGDKCCMIMSNISCSSSINFSVNVS